MNWENRQKLHRINSHRSQNESTQAGLDFRHCFRRQERRKQRAMFERLKKGFKEIVNKVTTAELKPENMRPILSDFKMSLVENDVAFPVADHVCDELEKRLTGVQVKRLDDRKKLVDDNLRQVLLEVMLTKCRI